MTKWIRSIGWLLGALLAVVLAALAGSKYRRHIRRGGAARTEAFNAEKRQALGRYEAAAERARAHQQAADEAYEKAQKSVRRYNDLTDTLKETEHETMADIARRFNRLMR